MNARRPTRGNFREMATEHVFEATTRWTGGSVSPTVDYNSYSREYTFDIPGKPLLTGSAAVPYRGDEHLHNPEDLLLAAVSACHLLSYLALCARSGIQVFDYSDKCTAIMKIHDGKMRIVEATLQPYVSVGESTDLEKALELHHEAHATCFIANSVNFPIRHLPEFSIHVDDE